MTDPVQLDQLVRDYRLAIGKHLEDPAARDLEHAAREALAAVAAVDSHLGRLLHDETSSARALVHAIQDALPSVDAHLTLLRSGRAEVARRLHRHAAVRPA